MNSRSPPSRGFPIRSRTHSRGTNALEESGIKKLSYTQIALVCFFAVSTVICLTASITIFQPSTPLSAIWVIKPQDFETLLELAPWSGVGFLTLSVLMACAAWGCWQKRRWGWTLAIAIFIANGAGDVLQILGGRLVEGATGVAVTTAIVIWLARPKVRAGFGRR